MQPSCQILAVGDSRAPGEENTGRVGLIGKKEGWSGKDLTHTYADLRRLTPTYAHFTLIYAESSSVNQKTPAVYRFVFFN